MMTRDEIECVCALAFALEETLTPEDCDLLTRAVDLGLGYFKWDVVLDDAVFYLNYDAIENLRGG